jgi:hypothetical protein
MPPLVSTPPLALTEPPLLVLAPPAPSAAASCDDPPHAERDKQITPTVVDLMNTLHFLRR